MSSQKETSQVGKVSRKKPSSAVQKKNKNKKRSGVDPLVFKEEVKSVKSMLQDLNDSVPKSRTLVQKAPLSMKDIPFFREAFSKGTQVPLLRLYFAPTNVTIGSNLIAQAVAIDTALILDWNDFDDLFSEYRFVRGEVQYLPFMNPTTSVTGGISPAVGFVSYRQGDSAAPASLNSAVIFDNKKWFIPCTVGNYGETKLKATKWPLLFDFIPDQQWNAISDATPYAYFKVYGGITGTNGTVTGYVTGWIDVQFRGFQ